MPSTDFQEEELTREIEELKQNCQMIDAKERSGRGGEQWSRGTTPQS